MWWESTNKKHAGVEMFITMTYSNIDWVILHQQKLLFTHESNLKFVQPTNVSTLATYPWWERIKFILLTVKCYYFRQEKNKERKKKRRYEASLVKSSLILQCCTNLYEKLTWGSQMHSGDPRRRWKPTQMSPELLLTAIRSVWEPLCHLRTWPPAHLLAT